MNKKQKAELRKLINWFTKEYKRKDLYAPKVYREAMVRRLVSELREYVRKA